MTLPVMTTKSLLGHLWMKKNIVLPRKSWPNVLVCNWTGSEKPGTVVPGSQSSSQYWKFNERWSKQLRERQTTKTSSSLINDGEFTTPRNEDCNISKAKLARVERLNTYIELLGTLWKEAYDKIKIKVNNALVQHESISSPPLPAERPLESASKNSAPRKNVEK